MKINPVVFKNRNGNKLFGILEQPDNGHNKDLTILILSPGIKMRVGPHRLYNKFSKILVEAGYTVLRYDFYGLGDSEGEIEERDLASIYNSIQDGRYVEDTVDAMDWLDSEYGLNRFILSGLCGGAITGLLAGCDDVRVEGLLAIGLINVFEGGEGSYSQYITDGELEFLKRGYIEKITDIESWKRLLSFKSDFRAIFKIFLLPLKKVFLKVKAMVGSKKYLEIEKVEQNVNSNVNPKFAASFFKMLQNSKKMLLIFSGQDRLLHEYNEKFETVYKKHLKPFTFEYEVQTIDHANHILSDHDWEVEMHKHALKWLNRFF